MSDVDDFDFAEQPDDAEPEQIGMAVPARVTDVVLDDGTVIPASKVIEVVEAMYLEDVLSGQLPIPFFSEGEDLCDPPTPPDATDMMKRWGITPQEYQELMSHD
jgi:hypothetical protein